MFLFCGRAADFRFRRRGGRGHGAVRTESQRSLSAIHPHDGAGFLGRSHGAALFHRALRGPGWERGLAACAATLARYEGWFLLPFVAAVLSARRRGRAARRSFSRVLAGLGPLFWLGAQLVAERPPAGFYQRPVFRARHPGRQALSGKGRLARCLALLPNRRAALRRAGAGVDGRWRAWRRRSSSAPSGRCCCWPSGRCSTSGACTPRVARPFTCRCCRRTPTTTPATGWRLCRCWRWAARRWWRWLPARARALGGAWSWWWPLPCPGCSIRSPANWVTWEESRVNSEARREWTRQAAEYLAPRYQPGSGILTSFGDLTGVFRAGGHSAARDFHRR